MDVIKGQLEENGQGGQEREILDGRKEVLA